MHPRGQLFHRGRKPLTLSDFLPLCLNSVHVALSLCFATSLLCVRGHNAVDSEHRKAQPQLPHLSSQQNTAGEARPCLLSTRTSEPKAIYRIPP
jgi:hypothetical protein